MTYLNQKDKLPVFVSALHIALHVRYGGLQEKDEYTAGLTRLAAKKTGAARMPLTGAHWRENRGNIALDSSIARSVLHGSPEWW